MFIPFLFYIKLRRVVYSEVKKVVITTQSKHEKRIYVASVHRSYLKKNKIILRLVFFDD